MARNGSKGKGRLGQIGKRVQVLNPLINKYIEINTLTHKFINQKYDSSPFKGVRKHLNK